MRTRTFRAALLAMVAVGMLFSLGVSTAIADPTGVIQGHVTDSVTGLPIGGACIVHLWNTTTWGYYDYVGLDSDGFYRFEGLSAGNYMCWISDTGTPPNHIEYNPTTQVDPPFAVLASDDSSVTVDVTMHPYGHIKGHVSAKTGG